MTVFKYYLILMKRQAKQLFLFLGIFFFFSYATSQSAFKTQKSFTDSLPRGTVVNKDSSEISENLASYIQSVSKSSFPIAEDEAEEMVYQGAAEFYFIIPEGFGKDFEEGKGKLKAILDPKSPRSYMLKSDTEKYLLFLKNTRNNDGKYDFKKVEEAVKIKSEVTLVGTTVNEENVRQWYLSFFNFMAYGLLSVFFNANGMVMREFSDKPLKMRNLLLPVSSAKFNLQIFTAQIVSGIISTLSFIALTFMLRGSEVLKSIPWAPVSLNLITFNLAGLAMAFLMTSITTDKNVMQALSVAVPLGLSFISGVMVPVEFLAPYVVNISKFFPLHYYIKANSEIFAGRQAYITSLIPLLFALFYFLLGVYLQKVNTGVTEKSMINSKQASKAA